MALLTGGLLGPLVGWFVGTFATFFAAVVTDETGHAVRGMQKVAALGGLLGIPLGAIIGLVVSLPLRILSVRTFPFLKNPWIAALMGATIGWLCTLLIVECWSSFPGTAVYLGLHSMAVGGIVAAVTVLAKPKWL